MLFPNNRACKATVELQQRKYKNFTFAVVKDVLINVALGLDFMNQHKANQAAENEKHQTRVSLLLELVSDAYLTAN